MPQNALCYKLFHRFASVFRFTASRLRLRLIDATTKDKTLRKSESKSTYFMMSRANKLIKIDGRTGEGGGQVVRVAVVLAALTGKPLQIDNVRGNRTRGKNKRGGGLKAQHVSCIQCLAEATNAEVSGMTVGSTSIKFKSRLSPVEITNRNIKVKADSAASVLLVFQAVLPFLVFAGDEKGTPASITIHGGTNVSFSLSFEYLDQVLLPALERFGIQVERKLEYRGWSHGTAQIGSAKFIVSPLQPGQTLKDPGWPMERGDLIRIDVSIIVPKELQTPLKKSLMFELDLVFPGVEIDFVVIEDSHHKTRLYTLLVAYTSTGLRFGRDWLYDGKTKDKTPGQLSTEISQRVVDDLDAEIRKGGVVDEHLQDQLIVFQALAEGRSRIFGSSIIPTEEEQPDTMEEPFGDGSLHTTTARWVASQFLPVRWFDEGRVCEGAGWKISMTN